MQQMQRLGLMGLLALVVNCMDDGTLFNSEEDYMNLLTKPRTDPLTGLSEDEKQTVLEGVVSISDCHDRPSSYYDFLESKCVQF